MLACCGREEPVKDFCVSEHLKQAEGVEPASIDLVLTQYNCQEQPENYVCLKTNHANCRICNCDYDLSCTGIRLILFSDSLGAALLEESKLSCPPVSFERSLFCHHQEEKLFLYHLADTKAKSAAVSWELCDTQAKFPTRVGCTLHPRKLSSLMKNNAEKIIYIYTYTTEKSHFNSSNSVGKVSQY